MMQEPGQPGPQAWSGSSTEWLRAEGESADVVLSSRVRLARNLAGHVFSSRATAAQRRETLDLCRAWILRAGLCERMVWIDLHEASALDRSLLMERHLISKQHRKGRPAGDSGEQDPRAVAFSVPDERLSIMVNEEDHLRIQGIRSGLSLSTVWKELDAIDDRVESGLDIAFHPRFGYLTACPTNVGTGLRMSVMLHLPGLRLLGEIDKVKRAASDMNLAVRGFFGEGSEAVGDLYQISNQTTLGKTEVQILEELQGEIISRIIGYERYARRELLAKRRAVLEDFVWRAWGLLTNARLLSTDESMQALSLLRLGTLLDVVRFGDRRPDLATIHSLMLLTHPAHLQRAAGRELDQEQRRLARAALVRQRLAGQTPPGPSR